MKNKVLKLISFLLILATITTMLSFSVSAATVGKNYNVVDAVYTGTKAKVTYNTESYTIKNGKTIKFDAFFTNNLKGIYQSNGTYINRSTILNQVRFDVHVYDKNGKCVNYKYGICDNGSFKVMSNVKGIKQSEYKVTVTAYISSYKTLVLRAGDHANLAMSLKYKIK